MLTEFLSFQVAAGATNENAFANSRYATLSRPAMLTYYAIADSATNSASEQQVEITHGNVIIRTLSAVPFDATGDIGPETDKHRVAGGVADINDRIVIKATNTGGAAANFRIIVEISFA